MLFRTDATLLLNSSLHSVSQLHGRVSETSFTPLLVNKLAPLLVVPLGCQKPFHLVSRQEQEAKELKKEKRREVVQALYVPIPARTKTQALHLERATVENIIKKINRARVKMEQIKPGSTQPRKKGKG
jgi:DNA-dependent RNA polymerase auxiliary subunit epsilon